MVIGIDGCHSAELAGEVMKRRKARERWQCNFRTIIFLGDRSPLLNQQRRGMPSHQPGTCESRRDVFQDLSLLAGNALQFRFLVLSARLESSRLPYSTTEAR